MRQAVGVVAVVATMVLPPPVQAYTLIYPSANSAPLTWPALAMPVVMRVNDQTGPTLPNMAVGSDPQTALTRALVQYPNVAAIELERATTTIASGGKDGVNIISFANTAANRAAFEMAGGNATVALTLTFFSGSDITEADVLFNPALEFTTLLDTDAELRAAGQFDVQAVATHEFGHAIGLHHTGVQSATMWPLTSVLQRQLAADDIAAARTLYPGDRLRGRIGGTVIANGAPAFGAHVVAVASDGAVAAGALTLPNGAYEIAQLEAGEYDLYVEPLDGPHTSVPNVPCIRLGNMNGAGVFSNATLTTNFPTSFVAGVAVSDGQTAVVEFDVSGPATALNPVQLGPAVVDTGVAATVSGRPIEVQAGTDAWLAVAGPGMDHVAIDAIDLGSGIAIDPTSRQVLAGTCPANGSPLPFLVFRVIVGATAATGSRSIIVSAGSETAALTGAVRITPAAVACVGDCNGDGLVTVDELVRGVNIALGSAPIATCPEFDVNDSGTVTVDELVQAVNAALNGCVSALPGA